MFLLNDEIAFLRKVTTGPLVPMPRDREKRLIVQILISYRLIWLSGDHLISADRGVSVLANLARPRTAQKL
jgi:hypothetical protein